MFAVDPLTHKFPFYTPYSFSGNRVIDMIELEGAEPTGANSRFERRVGRLYSGKINQEQFIKEGQAEGYGALMGLAGLAAAYGGAALLPYVAEWFVAAAPAATTATLAAGKYGPDAVGFAAGALGYDGDIPGASGDELGRLVNKGLRKGAAKFYKGFSHYAKMGADDLGERLLGINFKKDVFETVLKKGSKVIQYVDDKTGKVGNYFAPVGSDASTLGINTKGRTAKTFTLTKDVTVLQSTAADYTNKTTGKTYSGGGTQFFSPDVKDAIK
jgi:hypothetical protein